MLAFNLAVFFRNLKGEEVFFTAYNQNCQMTFLGGVSELHEETGLSHHLTVKLNKDHLSCIISFDEEEEEEKPEHIEVDVKLIQHNPQTEEITLVETKFLFEEIALKPASQMEPEPDPGPMTA